MGLFGKKKDKKQEEEKEIEITEISVEGKDDKVALADATDEELNSAAGDACLILKNNRDCYSKAKKGAKTALTFICVGVGMTALNYLTGNQATILAVGGFGLAGVGIAKTISTKKKREKLDASNAEAEATKKAVDAELDARAKAKEAEEKAKAEKEKEEKEVSEEDLVVDEDTKVDIEFSQRAPEDQEEIEAEA